MTRIVEQMAQFGGLSALFIKSSIPTTPPALADEVIE
jgi:hypothetical protein